MSSGKVVVSLVLAAAFFGPASWAAPTANVAASIYARDASQAIDDGYTAKIKQYTTDPAFNTPLTDYLPAADGVPTPEQVLGHVSGAPNWLPYSKDVYRYFQALAKASPRVRIVSIGKTQEGRRMIAVAVADAKLLDDHAANQARLAKLSDPRTIGMDDAKAEKLIARSTPVYYITGTIHSIETGAPTALMELAYRLAVDNAPYIREIRSHTVTLITPIVEVDGRDRMVDVYNWHRAHLNQHYPPLMYWGHYVAHDNNRDAMTLTLNLTRHVLDTYIDWHAQVIHDLHESVPFLYDNTAGDGPFNSWIDPILTGEWEHLGWNNAQALTKLGLPGVFTHGTFDMWSPGYLMFLAATHNGIARLYETFGNHGADTQERILDPEDYQRTWYKPNPPLPQVTWSQRDNNNYEQSALLTTLYDFSSNAPTFLRNFYQKSKRSVEKPRLAGPAAYVFKADPRYPGAQARLLRLLQQQHAEIQKLTAPVTVRVAHRKAPDRADPEPEQRRFGAGSYVVRMDQPYSRIADTLLDRQYWAPDDPQHHPYDDTGWSLGDNFGVDVARVTDDAILQAAMQPVDAPIAVPEGLASIDMKPTTKMPRIALMHTWLNTQTEGWWRMTLDRLGIDYAYISTQDVAHDADLRRQYDVILFAPIGYGSSDQRIVDGRPMWGPPIPWQNTPATPNIGRIDATPDIRPGLSEAGLAHLKAFVHAGGLLVTAEDTARFAVNVGLAPGVFVTPKKDLNIHGTVLRGRVMADDSPITAGYGKHMALYSAEGQSFELSNLVTGDTEPPSARDFERATGRGGPHAADIPEARSFVEPKKLPKAEPWQALPLNVEQRRNNPYVIPENRRPETLVRYAAADDLLISGLLDHGKEIAERNAVVLAHYGQGHTLLFASNPIWRGETIGSYRMVFDAIAHYDTLDADARKTSGSEPSADTAAR